MGKEMKMRRRKELFNLLLFYRSAVLLGRFRGYFFDKLNRGKQESRERSKGGFRFCLSSDSRGCQVGIISSEKSRCERGV